MYKLVETFKSIQSEGRHAGTPATFIRFFGCNLQCKFTDTESCDEPLHTDKGCMFHASEEDILSACKGIKHVVITGGEPSLYDLNDLISKLRANGHYVQVETNGTNIDNIRKANWITYSPKMQWDSNAPKLQAGFHELKLLASEECPPDVEQWATVKKKYIQPLAMGDYLVLENIRWCAEWVVKHPEWKLSLQCHKMYGGQ